MSSLAAAAGDGPETGSPFDHQPKEETGSVTCTGDYSRQVSLLPEQNLRYNDSLYLVHTKLFLSCAPFCDMSYTLCN